MRRSPEQLQKYPGTYLMRKLLTIIFCLALSATASSAAEVGVFVLFSADIPQYRQAYEGFQGEVRNRKGSVSLVEHNLEKEGGESIAQQIGSVRPHLIFAVGPEAAKFAMERARNTPIVFAMVLRPLAGSNLTGVVLEIPIRTKLEKIRSILPHATRIGVVYSAASASLYLELVQECKALGLQAVGRKVDTGKEFPEAFTEIAPRIDLFLMLPDTKVFFQKSIEFLLVEGMKNRVPVVGLAASYTRAGALISFEADYLDIGRQAGEIAARVIGGEKSENIETARLRKVKTSLNLMVAERVGIKIDPQAIREASDVFK